MAIWLILACGFSLYILWLDVSKRRVPNWLILGMAGSQCVWIIFAGLFAEATAIGRWELIIATHWLPALATAFITLVVLFPLWRFRAMGAGDVKFAAVLGFCMGPLGLLQAFIIGSLLAGVHAVLYVVQQQAPWLLLRVAGTRAVPRSTPYAAYLAVGVLFGVAWQLLNGQPWLQRLAQGV